MNTTQSILMFLMMVMKDCQSKFYSICKVGSIFRQEPCENIYVWNDDFQNYISLLNVTLLQRNSTTNMNSIRGTTVRVIADNMLPYVTSSNYSQELGGFLGDIWHLMENSLGFKSNVSSIFYDTGLQIMTSGGADVMLASVVEKPGLLNVYYSQPYFYNWYHLFIKRPAAKASSSSYLKTFDTELWFVTLIMFTILTITIWITIKFLNRNIRNEPNVSIFSCFLGVIAGFINQGFDLKLSSYSGRMQVMFSLILGVILFSAMNAVLVAQLAIFEIPFPFTSIDDVLHKRTHSLCLRTNSFVYNNFTLNNGIVKTIIPKWKNILNGHHCLDINNQTNLARILCNDNVIFLENRVIMETIQKRYNIPCDIMNHPKRLFIKGNHIIMLKSFPYIKSINGMLKKMKSTGILQRLEDKWVRRDKLENLSPPQSPQVTLDHISGILVLCSILFAFSILILCLEIFHHRYYNIQENHDSYLQ